MVAATDNNTQVEVHYNTIALPDEQFTLDEYEVFTTSITGDFTGTSVVADKPISVYSSIHGEVYAAVSDISC